jgi:3-dehydroquinate dehydratase-1
MEFGEFVLVAATGDLDEEPAAREHADALEFRMDLAERPREQLRDYDGALPIVATNRVEREGGTAPATPERLDALVAASDHPRVEAVDVELDAIRSGDGGRVVEHAREQDVSVLASVHDFEGTPSRDRMGTLLEAACDRAEVGKLAVTAGSPADTLDLLAATWAAAAEGLTVATMAMGEPGRHSRAVAPLYGSRVGYAPVDPARATAPGQFDLATLAGLVEQLGTSRRTRSG